MFVCMFQPFQPSNVCLSSVLCQHTHLLTRSAATPPFKLGVLVIALVMEHPCPPSLSPRMFLQCTPVPLVVLHDDVSTADVGRSTRKLQGLMLKYSGQSPQFQGPALLAILAIGARVPVAPTPIVNR